MYMYNMSIHAGSSSSCLVATGCNPNACIYIYVQYICYHSRPFQLEKKLRPLWLYKCQSFIAKECGADILQSTWGATVLMRSRPRQPCYLADSGFQGWWKTPA